MSLKQKPILVVPREQESILPPAAESWAKSANNSTQETLPGVITPALKEMPLAPVTSALPNPVTIEEGKTGVSLRLAPSVQRRVKKLAFNIMESTGAQRITIQELIEQAVMYMLEREEPKYK